MRVLHIGFGFTPFRTGGLIEYAEDLMEAQIRHDFAVAFFTAGRRYPWFRKPRLWRWKRRGVEMFEVINSPLIIDEYKSRDPILDAEEPITDAFLKRTIATFRPDVIHIQELCSLPSSVLSVVERSGIPNLMTLQDYLPLCPTFRLFDYFRQVCLVRDVGAKCVPCTQFFSGNPRHLFNITAWYELNRFLRRPGAAAAWRLKTLIRGLTQINLPVRNARNDAPLAAAFQRRRDLGVERLSRLDLLVAQSHRVETIYRTLGIAAKKIRTLHLTVDHLQLVKFREQRVISKPITFITLNGCATVEKGAQVMLTAMREVIDLLQSNQIGLLIYGNLHPETRFLLSIPNVAFMGVYSLKELDCALDKANVGIMPSIWEEAFGYAGLEMLAKGLPVIGNNIGGITDYVKPGKTGWLNETNTGLGLARIIREIADDPAQVTHLNAEIRRRRNEIIKTMDYHFDEITALYRNVQHMRVAGTNGDRGIA